MVTNYKKLLFICILNIIYFYFSRNTINSILLENNNNSTINDNNNKSNFEYFFCFCALGKKENLYSRQLISYYLNLGVEKFVFGDNNDPNTEKLSDVL